MTFDAVKKGNQGPPQKWGGESLQTSFFTANFLGGYSEKEFCYTICLCQSCGNSLSFGISLSHPENLVYELL